MKKTIACIMLITLTIAFNFACTPGSAGTNTPSPVVTDEPTALPPTEAPTPFEYVFDRETDFDNRFATIGTNIAELDDMIVWYEPTSERFMMYYDKAADEYGVLCAKPECIHDGIRDNPNCIGYITGLSKIPSLSYYMGKLYWKEYYHAEGSNSFSALFRMDPDSSNMERVFSIETPEGYAPQEMLIHRGRLYMRCVQNRVVNGVPSNTVAVISTPIDRNDFRIDCEEVTNDPADTWSNFMSFIGDSVYLCVGYKQEDGPQVTKVFRIKCETGESEEILSETAINEHLADFWIEPDGTMYFSPIGNEADAKLWRYADGKLEPFAELGDADGRFQSQSLCNGIICGTDKAANGISFEVWLRDFNRETLYKGPLTRHFIDGTQFENEKAYFICITGGRDSLLVCYSIRIPGAPLQGTDEQRWVSYLVRYSLTENGLEEKLLIACDKVY